ncbi:MAG: methyltransferase domain-containing protein [Deltaproteobacteria bacterium]|nr:methyltransferase domain-containing protein [Deltaproteobacteria bacterium]
MSLGDEVAPRLMAVLRCPAGHGALTQEGRWLACASGCRFPVVEGTPVLLRDDMPQTIGLMAASTRLAGMYARGERGGPAEVGPLWAASLGVSDAQRADALAAAALPGALEAGVDPAIGALVGATNGIAYARQVGRLAEVPIPELPMVPERPGARLLDIGCSWGRWVVAAARRGFSPVGIDPSLGAVMAARRLAERLGLEADFVVGDARCLPFVDSAFDAGYSYSVLQHLGFEDATTAVGELGRVLARGGAACVQMPNRLGLRSLQHQARRRFREATGFEVRYWSLERLIGVFERAIGPTSWSVDCYFGLGLQASDLRFMTPLARVATRASEALKRVARVVPAVARVADSVLISARRA